METGSALWFYHYDLYSLLHFCIAYITYLQGEVDKRSSVIQVILWKILYRNGPHRTCLSDTTIALRCFCMTRTTQICIRKSRTTMIIQFRCNSGLRLFSFPDDS